MRREEGQLVREPLTPICLSVTRRTKSTSRTRPTRAGLEFEARPAGGLTRVEALGDAAPPVPNANVSRARNEKKGKEKTTEKAADKKDKVKSKESKSDSNPKPTSKEKKKLA